MPKSSAKPNTRTSKPRRSGNYWQCVVSSLEDGLAVIDRDFHISYANDAVLRRYGWDRSNVIGRYCYEVFHGVTEPCNSPEWECEARKAWETGQPAQAIHIHSYGAGDEEEERYVELKASPLRDRQGNITEAVLIVRDVTEAKRMEQRILEANRNLLALNIIADAVSQSLDLDAILNSALDNVLELMGGDIGGILLLDEATQTLSYRVYRGLSEEFVQSISGLRVGEGIAGTAAKHGEPIYVDNISQDPRLTRWGVIKEGLRAFASVPLVSKNRVLGVMNIASHTRRRVRPEDIQLLSSISNQIAIAIENVKLYDELRRREERRGELLRLVISTQEEERRRIARELHDETSQALTSLSLNLEGLAGVLPPDAHEAKVRLKEIQPMVTRTLDEIHKVIFELRPTLLDDLGLIPAVKWHVENYLEKAGVKIHLESAGPERRLPIEIETAIFRIIQEAATNIIRHAQARSAGIRLEFAATSVTVHIEDEGRGFDLNEVMSAANGKRGLGLLSMKERIEHLGGILRIQSWPDKGTQIDIEVPIIY